jgi:phosphate transport system substrate-binding protein
MNAQNPQKVTSPGNSYYRQIFTGKSLFRFISRLALILLLNSLAGCGALNSGDVILRLHGSNTIGKELAPALVEGYLQKIGAKNIKRNRGNAEEMTIQAILPGESAVKTIEIKAHGSDTAVKALENNECDIGMLSRRLRTEEVEKLISLGNLRERGSENVIAMDGIAIIVNKNNPVRELAVKKIAQIFTGEVTNWSEVTGGRNGEINVYARDDKSGTFDTFKNLVMGKDKKLAKAAKPFEDSEELSDAVSRDSNGIGFVGLPFIGNTSAIAVYDEGTDPLKPSPKTINTRLYRLYRELYFYLPQKNSNELARKLVNFAISDEGQDVANNVGFVSQNIKGIAKDDESKEDTSRKKDIPRELAEIIDTSKQIPTIIYFETGSNDLDNKSIDDLDRVLKFIQREDPKEVILAGFADHRGSDEQCLKLSKERAKTVEKEFSKVGLSPSVKYYGKAAQVDSKDTEEAYRKNRRVEIYYR